ncbi:MAG: beta-lactamase family protein [Candidatus Protistobacter heckmanni]|nr:beta-lactamase family protein [Candidatus Protistobacter heckmanni]
MSREKAAYARLSPGAALSAFALSLSLASGAVSAQPTLPDPASTDPVKLGWMQGFPPPPDKLIRFADGSGYRFPQLRWTFNHYRELLPTANVARGKGPVSALPAAPVDLDGISFKTMTGASMNWTEALAKFYTDGILVMHKGKVVYEKYFGEGREDRQHIAMSVTKSFVGTLAAMLVAEGKLDPAAPVTKYLPEMKDTAYADATVRQVMGMTVGVKYSENYADPNADIWVYARSGGMLPAGPDYKGPRNFYDYLVTLKKEGAHGEGFACKTVNAEVLAWIVKRVSGMRLADLLSERIWKPMGAEFDAYFQVDSLGNESGGGGLNTALRDLARFGETLRNDGYFNGKQILAKEVVADIRKGASKSDFAKAGYQTLPGFSYRNMWWVSHNEHGVYMARGIHGQTIYVDPKAEMVIVRYASHPIAANGANDPISLPAFAAAADFMMKR